MQVSFYQTWKSKTVPDRYQKNQKLWIDTLTSSNKYTYSYLLLDDTDLRNLVLQNFPQYIRAYDGFTANIERVDFARYVMMWLGGVYADLDTYPTKSIDIWVDKGKVVLGSEPLDHGRKYYDGRKVVACNAFMISPPKQSIWVDLMDYIIAHYEPNYKPVYNTGPMAMTLFMEANPEKFKDVIITDPCVFFPMEGDGKISKECNVDRDTYVIHEWDNTWVVPWWKDQRWFNSRYWGLGALTIAVLIGLYIYNKRKHN
jgi:hypothetical protein